MSHNMNINEIAKQLVVKPKGILAADESVKTMKKRMVPFGVEGTDEIRRQWRELLLTTVGIEKFISGVILFDETIRQSVPHGKKFTDILIEKGIQVGIKVDEGIEPMPDSPEEVTTKGLDGLPERLAEYKAMGATFTKWRSVVKIGAGLPTQGCLERNAEGLAQYALACQKLGLVPILEPEVLLEGDHGLEQAEKVTTDAIKTMFEYCKKHGVDLTGLLLKSSMVLPGNKSSQKATPEQIAEATTRCFKNSVPHEVPGIVFLSGGQTPEAATANLRAIAKSGKQPWPLTFSYSRALEGPVLDVWQGVAANLEKAQKIFYTMCKKNSRARMGKF